MPKPPGKTRARGRAAESGTGSPGAFTLTSWVALRLSLHVCKGRSHDPGPAQQMTQKMAQLFAHKGHSGTLGDPRGWPGVLGAGVPSAARRGGTSLSPISPAHQSVHAPPISVREPPGAAPHVGPYGLVAPAPDWPRRSQSEGVVSSCLANWLRGAGQGGVGLPFVLPSAAPRAPPQGPLPPGLRAAGSPTPDPGLGPPGAAAGLQAAAEAPPS